MTKSLLCKLSFSATALVLAACGFPKPSEIGACVLASDCTSADAPFCVAGHCVSACSGNGDCSALAGAPLCDTSTGQCVSCLDATSCPSDRHVCDTTAHHCRGCIRDEECAGGICREVDGVCVADADVVFVSSDGWTSGSCTRQAACTFLYGLSVATPMRPHMKIVDGPVMLSSTVSIPLNLYIEGDRTVISGPEGMFDLAQGSKVTLSHVRLQPASGGVVTVGVVQWLRLYDVQTDGGISVTSGVLDVDLSTFVGGPGIQCMSGTVTLQRSLFDNSPIQGMTCQLVVRRTHLDMSRDAGFVANGGTVIFENNLLTQSKGIADSMALVAVAPSSVVRFNTFVNTDPEPSDGVALYCDSSMAVSSNIFAYGSMHPVARACNSRYSIYDQVTLPPVAVGIENKVADSATIFVDRAAKNYRLSGTKPGSRRRRARTRYFGGCGWPSSPSTGRIAARHRSVRSSLARELSARGARRA